MKNINIFTRNLLMACALTLGTIDQVNAASGLTIETATTYTLPAYSTDYKIAGTDQGYYYRLWKTIGDKLPYEGGSASITVNSTNTAYNASGQFGGAWSNGTDVIIGKGQAVGTYNQVINYNVGSLTIDNGSWFFGAYGWLKNSGGLPIEYYVEENSNIAHSAGHRGSYTSDGATYDIYVIARPAAPEPTTWYQVRSVRRAKAEVKKSYRITMANHYANWQSQGFLKWTGHEYSIFCVEDYNFYSNAAKGSINATIW